MSDTPEALAEKVRAAIRWTTAKERMVVRLAAHEALDALLARLTEAEKGCEWGCGPTGVEYVTAGFGIVPACPVHGWISAAMDSARDRAEAAEADRDRYEKERDEAWDALQGLAQDHYFARAEAAEADRDRYRKALEAIEALRLNENVTTDKAIAEARHKMRNLARAALSPAVLP